MTSELQVTLIFAALFAILFIPMTIAVGLYRAQTGIFFLHGDDPVLLRRMRAHGNFAEQVPFALVLMAGAELTGTPPALILGAASLLLAARVVHYWAIVTTGTGTGRAVGAGATLLVDLFLAGAILWNMAMA